MRKIVILLFLSLSRLLIAEVSREKRFVIIIPSYNNQAWFRWNLDSVFSQNYENYRIIYIADAWTEGTMDDVLKYVKECGQEHRFTFIKNEKRQGELANRFVAIHLCNGDEIAAMLDGDDALLHPNVLLRLNEEYQNPDTWLTYSQYQQWCSFCQTAEYSEQIKASRACKHKKDICWQAPFPDQVIEDGTIRAHRFCEPIHLRTFYVWLFKSIKREDLLFQGSFLPDITDWATMFYLVEMAREHTVFIDEPLLLYNRDLKMLQERTIKPERATITQLLRSQTPYNPIQDPREHEKYIV